MQQKTFPAEFYINGILSRDRVILSKAITIIESTRKTDELRAEEIIQGCLKVNKISKRIAITGAPGAGKSTLLNALGKFLLKNGESMAVLAIDPSSIISKGSILGDKTRMEDIANNEKVYIRPTASSNSLGGVARKTRETILLCEAFGFDYIFVETVGVGQSEIMAKNMTDLFILLLLPNAGDELQGIKRGIMEMADIILINKSDKSTETTSKIAAAQVKNILHLFSDTEKEWTPQVLNTSSLENTGLEALEETIESYFIKITNSGFIQHMRTQQQLSWMEENIVSYLSNYINSNESIACLKQELKEKIKDNSIDANRAAKLIVEKIVGKL